MTPRRSPRRAPAGRRSRPTPSDRKLQRWVDLIAALLCRHYGATFEELAREVPAYAADRNRGARERMFERDKEELREFGIPIDTREGDGEAPRYVLVPSELYLPYLALVSRERPPSRRATAKPGYRALPTLELAPDELMTALSALRLAAALGDPALAADADAAARKLTFDMDGAWPPTDPAWDDSSARRPPPPRVDAARLRELGEALLRRKRATFAYHGMGHDADTPRSVEPYGLFFQSGHWYLASHDVAKPGVRNFRVDRIAALEVNHERAITPDYEIPASFRLAAHAASRQAWELGDGDAEEMILEFRGRDGATRAAAALGRRVPGAPNRRTFEVRRVDAFARWASSFGGCVVPVSPPRLVDEWRALAERTLALYSREDDA